MKEILEKLVNEFGIQMLEYYGSIIYGGHCFQAEPPEVRQFFQSCNEGNYTVQIFRIPDHFYKKELDMKKVREFLEK